MDALDWLEVQAGALNGFAGPSGSSEKKADYGLVMETPTGK